MTFMMGQVKLGVTAAAFYYGYTKVPARDGE